MIVTCDVSLFKYQVAGKERVVAIIRDVRERISFIDHLDRKNREIRQVYEVLDQNSLISYSDINGEIINVNENYERVSGYSFDETVGTKYRVVNSDYHSQEFWRDLWSTILDKKIWSGEIKNKSKSGKYFWLQTYIYPILSRDSDKIDYFLEVSQDITLLKNYQFELEEKVEERTAKLQELNNEKDFLMSMMSHDLKNPLTAIYMQLSLLETYASRYRDDKMVSKTRLSMKIAKEMDHLIRNILELNEVNTRMVIDKSESIDLEIFLINIKNSFKPLLTHKEQELAININGSKRNLKSNSTYLKQILDNLISNAIKYSKKNSLIQVNISFFEAQIIINVVDNGLGIKKEEMSKLFIKFSRLSNKPTDGEGSNGLGLAIVKRLCELMDYRIEVDSEFGEGTTFRLIIPN